MYAYETIQYRGRLSFKDTFGLDALYETYQLLRIVSEEVSCVSQRIWGDGDQLQQFIAPGTHLVQTRREGRRTVLVSTLDRPVKAGQEVEVYTARRIHHAFKSDKEWWEFTPFTPTQRSFVAIDFPIGKEPRDLQVEVSNGAPLPDVQRPGTKAVSLFLTQPPVGSVYRVSWSW